MKTPPDLPKVRQSPLTGCLVQLEPLGPHHKELVHTLSELALTTRPYLFHKQNGDLLPAWEDMYNHYCFVKLVIISHETGEPVGLCMAYDLNLRDRVACLGLDILPDCTVDLVVAEAAGLLINYILTNWDLRKLYVYSGRYPHFHLHDSLSSFFLEEGCLREHYLFNSQTWDDTIFAFYSYGLDNFNKQLVTLLNPLHSSLYLEGVEC